MAVEMFLKLAGIAGESQNAQHKGEIDILGWSWGVAEAQAAAARPPGSRIFISFQCRSCSISPRPRCSQRS